MPSVDILKVAGNPPDPDNDNAVGIGFDSDAVTVKVNNAGTIEELVEKDAVQTLTHKELDFSSLTPTTHPILFSGMTMAANTNLIRGVDVIPTRASGWTAFTGTVGATPAAVYSDYRELHTSGTAVVLGIGSFPYMDSGASCNSLWGGQFISYASSGSTVTTAAAAPLTGVYAIVAKSVIDSATVNSGAQIGAIALSVQANVTDISGRASCIAYMEVASGTLRDIFFLNATASNLATNLFYFSAAVSPLTTGGSGTPTAASGTWYNMRFSVAGTPYYFPVSSAAWTNA